MQEHRWDGTDEVTPQATPDKALKALANELNRAVTLHKPGSIIKRSDGSEYRVHDDGSLRKIKDKD